MCYPHLCAHAAGSQQAPWAVFSQDAGLQFAHPPSTGLLCPQKQLGSCSHAKCTCIYSCVLYPTCSTSTPSALTVLLQQIFQCQILYEHKKKNLFYMQRFFMDRKLLHPIVLFWIHSNFSHDLRHRWCLLICRIGLRLPCPSFFSSFHLENLIIIALKPLK